MVDTEQVVVDSSPLSAAFCVPQPRFIFIKVTIPTCRFSLSLPHFSSPLLYRLLCPLPPLTSAACLVFAFLVKFCTIFFSPVDIYLVSHFSSSISSSPASLCPTLLHLSSLAIVPPHPSATIIASAKPSLHHSSPLLLHLYHLRSLMLSWCALYSSPSTSTLTGGTHPLVIPGGVRFL